MAISFHIHLARGIITYLLSQAKTLPLVKAHLVWARLLIVKSMDGQPVFVNYVMI